jgi:hypothetical protein
MNDEEEVLAAATARAEALGRGDATALRDLLHPRFAWTSHKGETFDRESYLQANTAGPNRWHGQRLEQPRTVVVGDVAVLRCTVADEVDSGAGRRTYRMPMTQTWLRVDRRWQCLAGHAGPLLS